MKSKQKYLTKSDLTKKKRFYIKLLIYCFLYCFLLLFLISPSGIMAILLIDNAFGGFIDFFGYRSTVIFYDLIFSGIIFGLLVYYALRKYRFMKNQL